MSVYNVSRRLSHAVRLDDTDGYFVIGGGEYTRGVEGYFGPVVYQRNRITPLVKLCSLYLLLLLLLL